MSSNSRNRRRFPLKPLFLTIAALLLFSGCVSKKGGSPAPESPDRVQESNENVLKVGVTANIPPFIYKEKDRFVGLEAQLALQFSRFLGKSVRFIDMDWEEQIPALLEGRTDIIMSGMTRTQMREIRIAFSDPYMKTGQMALVRTEDRARFMRGYQALVWANTVGVIKGTTGEQYVHRFFYKPKKISLSSPKKAVEALLNKEIDVFIYDMPVILLLASENEINGLIPILSPLTEEYLAWGMRKSDTELLNAANRFIGNIQSNRRLDELLEWWIPLFKTLQFPPPR